MKRVFTPEERKQLRRLSVWMMSTSESINELLRLTKEKPSNYNDEKAIKRIRDVLGEDINDIEDLSLRVLAMVINQKIRSQNASQRTN